MDKDKTVVSRHFLNVLASVLYKNRVGIILNGLTFFLLWMEPQGKDLVLSLNQDGRMPVFLFYTLVFLVSAIVWYAPRYLYKDDFKRGSLRSLFRDDNKSYYVNDRDPLQGHLRRMIPRILGTSLLLTTSFAFLNILIEFKYSALQSMDWPLIGVPIKKASVPYVMTLVVLFALIIPSVYDRLKRFLLKNKVIVITVLLAMFILQTTLIYFNNTAYNSVQEVFYIGLMLSVFFAGFVIARKSLYLIKKINGKMILIALIVLIGLGSVPFILSNLVLLAGNLLWDVQIFHPLIILFSALVFYATLVMLLIFIGKATHFTIKGRLLKLQYLTLVIFVWLILSEVNRDDGHFNITLVEHSEIKPEDRPELHDFFDDWYQHRQNYIEDFTQKTGRKYPIIIVSSEGGGSRAALWSLMVNAYLQDQNPNYFNNHLFAFTNASGGGTGNSMFLSFMENGTDANLLFHRCGEIFTRDYLSSSIALLLGFDGFQSVTGINIMSDRAAVLENEWQIGMSQLDTRINFQKPFLEYWNNGHDIRSDLPLLFLNTTNVQSGNHAISAPVKVNQGYFPNSIDMLDFVDSLTGKTINLATAALLNARFPFVNPVGSVPNCKFQFGDAGYYDNYGAENAANIIMALKGHLSKYHPNLRDKVEFVSIVIENSSVEKDSKVSIKPQFYAPVNALVKIRSANTQYALEDLERVSDVFYRFSLSLVAIPVDGEGNQKVIPGIPLARHLSKTAVRAIRESCLDKTTGRYPKFQKLLDRIDSDL